MMLLMIVLMAKDQALAMFLIDKEGIGGRMRIESPFDGTPNGGQRCRSYAYIVLDGSLSTAS